MSQKILLCALLDLTCFMASGALASVVGESPASTRAIASLDSNSGSATLHQRVFENGGRQQNRRVEIVIAP